MSIRAQHPAFTEVQLSTFNIDAPAAPDANAADIDLRNCATDLQFAIRCDTDRAEDYVQGSNRALSIISTGLALTVAQELKVQRNLIPPLQLLDVQADYPLVVAERLTRAVMGFSKTKRADQLNEIFSLAGKTRPNHDSVAKAITDVKRAPSAYRHHVVTTIFSALVQRNASSPRSLTRRTKPGIKPAPARDPPLSHRAPRALA